MTFSSADYASLSRQDLIDLCREKNVSGHSKKKVHELIELLMKAGVPPPGKTAPATSPKTATPTSPTSRPTTPTKQSHYIFNTEWQNVLPYLDEATVQLVIADPAPSNTGWLEHGLRILDSTGLFAVRGTIQPPPGVYATEVQAGTTITVLSKTHPFHIDVSLKSPTDLYELLLTRSQPDAITVLPFVADGAIAKLVKRKGRSMIAMDADESRVQFLYSLVG